MFSKDDKIKMLRNAFKQAIEAAGNVHQLHLKTGVSEASLNRYNSGKQDIANAPFSTLIQIFPLMSINYFTTIDHQAASMTLQPNGNFVTEAQLLKIFRSLEYDEQIRCLTVVAANFGERIRKETIT